MINPFFINKGPFKIESLLDLCDFKNNHDYKKNEIVDIKECKKK